jgi:hypothetical protein
LVGKKIRAAVKILLLGILTSLKLNNSQLILIKSK